MPVEGSPIQLDKEAAQTWPRGPKGFDPGPLLLNMNRTGGLLAATGAIQPQGQ